MGRFKKPDRIDGKMEMMGFRTALAALAMMAAAATAQAQTV
jgi:hypothetical protein